MHLLNFKVMIKNVCVRYSGNFATPVFAIIFI